MFQVVLMWNLTLPEQELGDNVKNIKLRGYNEDAFLTGEFAWKIAENEIKPLSASNIADKYCYTRRDLYFAKGTNRPSDLPRDMTTWGGKAGYLVENYVRGIVNNNIGGSSYSSVLKDSDNNHNDFINGNKGKIGDLKRLEKTDPGENGNTDLLIKLLKINGRVEFALKILNKILKKNTLLTVNDIETEEIDIKENREDHIKQIGINLPSSPDFIVPKYGVAGDIKTGTEFKSHFQLTCASYALAYENVKGKGNDINWGIIHFLPTRNPSWFVKPITFAQIYIFPIDDYLRQWFIVERDKAYSIISKKEPPEFPPENKREHCRHCKYKKYCQSQGLEVDK